MSGGEIMCMLLPLFTVQFILFPVLLKQHLFLKCV